MSTDVINNNPVYLLPAVCASTIEQTANQYPKQVTKILMDASQFTEITKTLSAINTEFRFFISDDGIESIQIDTANVCCVNIDYKPVVFEMFKNNGHVHEIGIDINQWKKFAKLVKKGNLVLFELTQYLREQSEEEKKNDIRNYFYKYQLSCNGNVIDIHALDTNTIRRKPNIPTIEHTTKVTLYASEFIEAVKGAKDVAGHMRFISDSTGLNALSDGAESKLNKRMDIIGISGPEIKSLFSIEFLYDIAKAITANKKEVIELSFKTDYPIKISIQNEYREINYLLAPRIEAN